MIKGQIHSIETMGLFDGPGIRTVFFFQGCPLKCSYCHNPDSQSFKGGKTYSVDEIVKFSKRYKPYYKDNGGVTFSGGEALMQGEFLLEAIKALKAEGIHVALDTSGVGISHYYKEVLDLVDLLILDIKHYQKDPFRDLTGISMKRTTAFFEAVSNYKNKLWIRHVMVPGITDSYQSMDALYEFISNWSKMIEKIEILPYHKLGIDKYYQLEMPYRLKDTKEMDKEIAFEYQQYLMKKLDKDQIEKRIAV